MMLALAKNYGRGYTYLKDIAQHEGMPEKYLSLIAIPLKGVGLLNATRGAKGGYALARPPGEITVKEIVEALEGKSGIVDCIKDLKSCPRIDQCATREVWVFLNGKISEVLASFTLEQLLSLNKDKALQGFMPGL